MSIVQEGYNTKLMNTLCEWEGVVVVKCVDDLLQEPDKRVLDDVYKTMETRGSLTEF